jgi:hypothetical protein
MKTILGEDLTALDAGVIPCPWNDAIFAKYANKKKLKFGYYFDDGVTIASPPVERAVLMTVKALQDQGHEVVPVVPPNVIEAVHCFIALTTYDGYRPSPFNDIITITSQSLSVHVLVCPRAALLWSTVLQLGTPIYANPSPSTQWNQQSNSSSH